IRALDEDRIGPPVWQVALEGGNIGNAEAGVTQDGVDGVVADDDDVARAKFDDVAHVMQARIERVRVGASFRGAERGEDLDRRHAVTISTIAFDCQAMSRVKRNISRRT